jgi:glycosyltransferase involved in cell wall biosynthesis
MNIAFVAPRYHPHIGGVEYVVKSAAERLVGMGHDVTILAGEPEVKRPREDVVGDVKTVSEFNECLGIIEIMSRKAYSHMLVSDETDVVLIGTVALEILGFEINPVTIEFSNG